MKNPDVKKENPNSKKVSYKVSLGGIVAALCLLMMFLTAVFPPLNITLPIFAGMLITVVAVEVSPSWSFVTYVTVSLLSFFITPDKEAAIIFSLFFGYYPVLKWVIEKLKSKVFAWAVKLVVFNAAIIVIYCIIINFLGTVDLIEEFGFLKEYMLPVLFVFADAVFVMYDFTLGLVNTCYMKWFRPTFLRKFK